MTDREHRIRAKAHEIWQEEGRPSGQERAHWDRARAIIDDEDRNGQNTGSEEESIDPAAAKGKFFRAQGDLPGLKGQIEIAQGAREKGAGKEPTDKR